VKFVFEGKTIGRMEGLVMKTLKWRMQAVTPFTFISYFLDKFSDGKPPSFALASRCAEIIIGTLKGSIDLTHDASSSVQFTYLHCRWHYVCVYQLNICILSIYRLYILVIQTI